MWLCRRLREASDFKEKFFKSWRHKDPSTYIYCSLNSVIIMDLFFIIAVNGKTHLMKASKGLIKKIENFLISPRRNKMQLQQIRMSTTGEKEVMGVTKM